MLRQAAAALSSHHNVLIIADDLTGACDAAAAFAHRNLATRVFLDPADHSASTRGAVALTTESRDIDPAHLRERLMPVTGWYTMDSLFLKKIDSMFRGNTFAEIAVMADLFPEAILYISPAFPALGRKCIAGELHWSDAAGEGRLDLSEHLRQNGLRVQRLPVAGAEAMAQRLRAEVEKGHRIFLQDASTDADLRETAAAISNTLETAILWVGSAGLSHTLAHFLLHENTASEAEAAQRQGPVYFFIGSDHPVTRLQVKKLRDADNGTPYRLVDVPRGRTTPQAIREAMAGASPEEIGCIFLTGGDTAMFVCAALGASSIEVGGEFAPGIPFGRLHGGDFSGVPVILKSGGFGEPELLCRIRSMFEPGKEHRS
ncbi:MAG TPA: four-carbon acid sugar kinase family protein [Granulicella sp.]